MSPADKVRQALAANPNAFTRELMSLSGLDRATVKRIKAKLRSEGAAIPKPANQNEARASELTVEKSSSTLVASSRSTRIRSLEDLLAAAEVDLSVWEVERHVINKWEVAMREPATTVGGAGDKAEISVAQNGARSTLWTRGSNVPLHEELFQIKIWLRRRKPEVVGAENAMRELIAEAKNYAPKYAPIRYAKARGDNLAEVSIPDVHVGKLSWAPETGENYDVPISEEIFMEAIARLRDGALPYGVSRFLFPMGNDFFQSDNQKGTTTSGTPVDNDGRWQRTFTRGREILVRGLEYLAEKAPVDVIHVPGNHDWERSFYLAEVLAAWFRNNRNITFDLRPTPRKYTAWGNTLLGFTHGNNEKERSLPLLMATEAPELWAKAKYRELHLGHLHHKKEKVYQPIAEDQGVRIRWLPSLSAADAWHVQQGYRGLRSAQGFVWSRDRGCVAELSHNL